MPGRKGNALGLLQGALVGHHSDWQSKQKEKKPNTMPGRKGNALGLLQGALVGHHSDWQSKQEEKMRTFVDGVLMKGLLDLHHPMMWGQASVKFLTTDDRQPKWMTEDEAIESLYATAEKILEARGVDSYYLDHGKRDFAGGKSFVFFRLCNDAQTSLKNWRAEMKVKTREYINDAVQCMVDSAANGDADVWAKLPSGRFSNYLIKDEVMPVGHTREHCIGDIKAIICHVLHEEHDLYGVEVLEQGTQMSGTWFKLTYHIPRPAIPTSTSLPRASRSSHTPVRSSPGPRR
eukprot:TRINITY_DN10158_c0_g1_i1.p1 TRINITY_DN10158_c0_g1~~TRINITY_DN10158_c0_g1_i1.p1  ORF type:complete len:290 (+),score=82.16 TRINITY_DN10158_c0_g1_i1:125-994(+)